MKTVLKLKARITIFMTLFCLAFTTTVFADNNDLKGIWSLESSNYVDTKKIVCYKIFNENGTFINLLSTDKGKTFVIASRGKYKVQMPNVYIEHLDETSARVHSASAIAITFKRNGDKLSLTLKLKGKDCNDVWKKTSIPTLH